MAAGPADELDGVVDIRCLYVLGSLLPSLMSCDDGGRIFEGVVCAAVAAASMLALSGGGESVSSLSERVAVAAGGGREGGGEVREGKPESLVVRDRCDA